MRRLLAVLSIGTVFLLVAWLALLIARPACTRLELSDAETGRKIFYGILQNGDSAELNWRNSLFGLDVTEIYVAEDGVVVETQVTFADPSGRPPMQVRPEDVNDLYHTGGPFTAKGLHRPFSKINYQVSEIGNPRLKVGGRTIDLTQEVGFGGRIVLAATPARCLEGIWRTDRE